MSNGTVCMCQVPMQNDATTLENSLVVSHKEKHDPIKQLSHPIPRHLSKWDETYKTACVWICDSVLGRHWVRDLSYESQDHAMPIS